MVITSDIYRRIRARRELLGLSQDELARKMGYKSRTSINKIEMGINDIPQSKVEAFAKALETTTVYLMGLDESLENNTSIEFYRKEKPINVSGDELWRNIENNPTKVMLARWMESLNVEQLERVVKLLDAALLLPPEETDVIDDLKK